MTSALDDVEVTFARWEVPVVGRPVVGGRPGLFTPTNVMVHHTAAPQGGPAPSTQVVRAGRPGLEGPLCNVLVRRDDAVEIVSRGKANHAGAGSWPSIPTDEGNRFAVGVEIEHTGTSAEPWPPARMAFIRRVLAALLDHIGQPATRVVAHKEYAPARKIDPYGWVMDAERREVARVLHAGPPTNLLEDLMADPAERAALIKDIAVATADELLLRARTLSPSTGAELGKDGTPLVAASPWQLLQFAAASAHDARDAAGRVEADLADGVRIETPPAAPGT